MHVITLGTAALVVSAVTMKMAVASLQADCKGCIEDNLLSLINRTCYVSGMRCPVVHPSKPINP
ncbi:hypothetical protein [Pseudomonas paeninsulae]|uniref:hypothetical protein n=1 Tax=Pseudomonas paeninsulae TaxID=3110772 RepID=UPI002D79FEC6|nr:hypothetical protein [Pseudomonas sp. IT1137]